MFSVLYPWGKESDSGSHSSCPNHALKPEGGGEGIAKMFPGQGMD